MKVGDSVKMSHSNPNHLGNETCAYVGMQGIVTAVYDDGSFIIDCGSSVLVVPANNTHKQRKKGVWIWLNNKHIFHKFAQKPRDKSLIEKLISFLTK